MTHSSSQPFTHQFPRADIHEVMSPDLLHQLIKGTFFDHLVKFTNDYLYKAYPKEEANRITQDIDRRISAVPAFPGLRRFPDGWDFNQWTGDDSKALMKVYIAAIQGHVPSDIVKTFSAFMECCFIVRKNSLAADDFAAFDYHLSRFHEYREIFITTGVRDDLSLPRQHALKHYPRGLRTFGSPNGLCSSITESKHIKAMLKTITRLEKMNAIQQKFRKRGWLVGSTSWFTNTLMDPGADQAIEEAAREEFEDSDDEEGEFGPVEGPKAESSIRLARCKGV
ncbi:hypothetical protein AAF712_010131 [Marasmius tenuissimus]|uniref:Uncharacterized protein n=1 Tax=Marasmius tenuissimus TaxID=585030 RepID=A0ABR2ZMW2_9AGAR